MISDSRCLMLVAVLPLMFVSLTVAGQEDTLERRFLMVNKLITSSSGAKQVEDSGIPEAIEAREQARQLYLRARSSAETADHEEVNVLLTGAVMKMFEATRLASGGLSRDKKMVDLAKREESVDTLVSALGRMEGDADIDYEKVMIQVDGYKGRAATMVQNDQLEGAIAMMNQAYDILKSAIEEVRGGETLIKSIQFDSIEEEYAYELDRNDTHRMLVTILTEQKTENAAKDRMIKEQVLKATGLRAEAENYATDNDIKAAIESLDASTKQLIRVIRMSGVYIPG